MLTKTLFNVGYPLHIFDQAKTINFSNKEEREELFKRNIYYYLFREVKNNLLEQKHNLFFDVGKSVISYLNKTHPELNVLNLSLFGSSTVIENPGDYDFLAITNGDIFLLEEPSLKVNGGRFKQGFQ